MTFGSSDMETLLSDYKCKHAAYCPLKHSLIDPLIFISWLMSSNFFYVYVSCAQNPTTKQNKKLIQPGSNKKWVRDIYSANDQLLLPG